MVAKEKREQPVVHGARGRRTKEAIERQSNMDQESLYDHPPRPRESMYTCTHRVVLATVCVCLCVGYDSSKEKKRLQNIMSFGSEVEEHKVASSTPVQKDEQEIDRFEEGLCTLCYDLD